jgi:hypothetical protein
VALTGIAMGLRLKTKSANKELDPSFPSSAASPFQDLESNPSLRF